MDKVGDFLLKILHWVGESPFRLFAVILLFILAVGGWFFYTEKDALMASYRAQQALPKMNGNYEAAANFIFTNSEAELVAIFEVNTLINSRKLAYMVTKAGRIKDHDGYDVGLFSKNFDNNHDVIGLMSGKVPCGEYLKPQSFIGFVYRKHDISYMCRISVPVEPGTFIGQISVGWKTKPAEIENAITVLNIASGLLYDHKK